jgi:diadenosine tetraphosphate (Ap4A) HIT family hydrolase
MTASHDCMFCKIVAREAPVHVIWEDEKHLAFLSIFPNTEGFSVVIPKAHYSSYLFDQQSEVISYLVLASGQVAKLIDRQLTDVGRTGMIFEGFGVDHLHSKLSLCMGLRHRSGRNASRASTSILIDMRATYGLTILNVPMTMYWRNLLARFEMTSKCVHQTIRLRRNGITACTCFGSWPL